MKGWALRSLSRNTQISDPVARSASSKASSWSSGENESPFCVLSAVVSRSSGPLPSLGRQNKFHFPALLFRYATRLPSGVQTASRLLPCPEVSWVRVPRDKSYVQSCSVSDVIV